MHSFPLTRYFSLGTGLLALLAGQLTYALETELPISILNMKYGNLLVVHQTAPESELWGYSQFDYIAKEAEKKNWHVTYNGNGSLSFKSLATNTCVTVNENSEVIHSSCLNDVQSQQFLPLLVASGALQLKNMSIGRCLASNNPHFLSAYSISMEECVEVATVPVAASMLWAFIPAQGNSRSLAQQYMPIKRSQQQELR